MFTRTVHVRGYGEIEIGEFPQRARAVKNNTRHGPAWVTLAVIGWSDEGNLYLVCGASVCSVEDAGHFSRARAADKALGRARQILQWKLTGKKSWEKERTLLGYAYKCVERFDVTDSIPTMAAEFAARFFDVAVEHAASRSFVSGFLKLTRAHRTFLSQSHLDVAVAAREKEMNP